MKNQDINVVALPPKPNGEYYIFLYDDASKLELVRLFGKMAINPDLSFDWEDAKFMSSRVTVSFHTQEKGEKQCRPLKKWVIKIFSMLCQIAWKKSLFPGGKKKSAVE